MTVAAGISLRLRSRRQYSRPHRRSTLPSELRRDNSCGTRSNPRRVSSGQRSAKKADGGHIQPPLSQRVLRPARRIRHSRIGQPARGAIVYHRDSILRYHRIRIGAEDESPECPQHIPHHIQLDHLTHSRIPASLRHNKASVDRRTIWDQPTKLYPRILREVLALTSTSCILFKIASNHMKRPSEKRRAF